MTCSLPTIPVSGENIRYVQIDALLTDDDTEKSYHTYGIAVLQDSNCILSANDLSTNQQKISQLVNQINDGKLAPIHLEDIIEDLFTF